MIPTAEALRSRIAASRPSFEEELRALVEIPSVSTQPAAHAADVRKCAEKAAALLGESGASDARIVPTGGGPTVIGTLRHGADAPTVTIYNHLDVQPADREAEGWQRDPWKLAIEGDRYYGRGATDDKGPAVSALWAARIARELAIPLNVQFLWETEEEIGSPGFERVFSSPSGPAPTESVLVSDTIWISRERPALSLGLRGLAPALIRLETATKDAHSGVAGGAARNPITELCAVVAGCVDAPTGTVKIPGFYDDVRAPSQAECESWLSSGFQVDAFQRALGLKSLRSTEVREITQRIWGRPTFEVHGIRGGYQGEGLKTAIPPRAEAKVSMRLVPDQAPAKIQELLARHVHGLVPDAEVVALPGLEPYTADPDDEYQKAAREALAAAHGAEPALVREGGSIGAVVTMQRHLRCPVVLMGLSLPEHGYHAPNEFFDWGQASRGILAFLHYFDRIARL
ncbi:MAG: M20/M25/M40 family metallo-hydrolase [Deltaproteobacteria bacterium]|nr:M20/M25/M40 family metallo-hydrolase [Deltaproteobacteria bacterium]